MNLNDTTNTATESAANATANAAEKVGQTAEKVERSAEQMAMEAAAGGNKAKSWMPTMPTVNISREAVKTGLTYAGVITGGVAIGMAIEAKTGLFSRGLAKVGELMSSSGDVIVDAATA